MNQLSTIIIVLLYVISYVSQNQLMRTKRTICDWAWENWSYLHIKFELILRVHNVITFICNLYCIYNVIICAEIHGECNKSNRFCIVHREQEIDALIQTSAFCVDKTYFPRLGLQLTLVLFEWKPHHFHFVVDEILCKSSPQNAS